MKRSVLSTASSRVHRGLIVGSSWVHRGFIVGTMVLISGMASGQASTLPGELPCRIVADQNCDGVVTPADFSAWTANYSSGNLMADQNGDAIVDPSDFSAWVVNYSQGENGPRGPAYDCQACTPTPSLVVTGIIATAPFQPVDVVIFEDQSDAIVTLDAGQIIDAVLFDAPGLGIVRYEDRLAPGDDPVESPAPDHVVYTFEHSLVGAFSVERPDGSVYHFSGIVRQYGYQYKNEITGVIVEQNLHYFDQVFEAGRWTTFADALAHASDMSDQFDLEIENPDPIQFPNLPDILLEVEAPDLYVVDMDNGWAITREAGNGPEMPDCNNPPDCATQAACWANDCVHQCVHVFKVETITCTATTGIPSGIAGCVVGTALCGVIPGLQPFAPACCAAGSVIGTSSAAGACFAAADAILQSCVAGCDRDFQRDLNACQ